MQIKAKNLIIYFQLKIKMLHLVTEFRDLVFRTLLGNDNIMDNNSEINLLKKILVWNF